MEIRAIKWFYNVGYEDVDELKNSLSDKSKEHIIETYKNRNNTDWHK